jgi:hypothetical protein
MSRPTLPAGLPTLPSLLLDGFVVVLILIGLRVVDDPQNLDEAEGSSRTTQGRLLVGVDLGHGRGRLPPRRLVAPGPEVQVDPATLQLELVYLTLTVVLAASLERQQLCVARERLKCCQHVSYRHAPSVAGRHSMRVNNVSSLAVGRAASLRACGREQVPADERRRLREARFWSSPASNRWRDVAVGLPAWSFESSDHPGSSRGSPGPAGNLPAGKDPALRAGSLIHPAGTLPAHTVTAAP